jgi:G3E family GTPase
MKDMTQHTQPVIPVHIISGFLGSGKTTLLNRTLTAFAMRQWRPVVVMNEIGDVNLDGLALESHDVPMAELLSGCICCTIRDDLSMQIHELVHQYNPDVLLIESTGIAQPIEIMDAVTEASLILPVMLRSTVVVVDGAALAELMDNQAAGRTYRLMRDQVRTASRLLLNKIDRLTEDETQRVEQQLREWNASAPIVRTIRCDVSIDELFGHDGSSYEPQRVHKRKSLIPHHSHQHVAAFTYFFDTPVNSHRFESMMKSLPDYVYRAKGIVSFTDTASRFLFQYAYRELELTRITPQGHVNDVAVFIGEQMDTKALEQRLKQLV